MAEETHDAAKTVPRAILFSYFAGAALNFGLLLSYLFSVTNVNNAAIPGFGVTGTCPTINVPTLEYMAANGGALPGFDATSEMLYMSGFGDLPAWSSNSFAGVPNDGVPLFSAKGACILSNGLPFSLFPIGNVFYDAFAARYPLCTPSEAFGSATWEYDASSGSLVNTTSFTGRYNVNSCLPINTPASQIPAGATACCDVTGAIAPSKAGRGGAIFFAFIIFGGSILSICSIFVAGSRFIYSFARDRGFPGPLNRVLSYVEPRTKAPLNAILMYLIAGIAFTAAWTNTSPTVAFNAVSVRCRPLPPSARTCRCRACRMPPLPPLACACCCRACCVPLTLHAPRRGWCRTAFTWCMGCLACSASHGRGRHSRRRPHSHLVACPSRWPS